MARAEMTLHKLLPNDTRLAELSSAWALLFLAVLVACGSANLIDGINISGLIDREPSPFWVVLLVALGVMQLLALYLSPGAEILRVILAWMAGTAWVWIGLASNVGHIDPPDPAAVILGVSNLYAFIVNGLLLKRETHG